MMKKIRLTWDKNNLYFISFFLCLIPTLIGSSSIININNYIKIGIYAISIILLMLKNCIDFKKKKNKINSAKLVFIFLFGIYSLVATIIMEKFFFIINYFLIISLKDINLKKIIKIDLYVKMIFLLLHVIIFVILYSLNNPIAVNAISNIGGRVRCTLLLTHGNIAAELILWTMIDYFYIILKENKLNNKRVFFLTIFMILVYFITKSRTTLIIYIIFIALLYIYRLKKMSRIINFFSRYGFEFLFVLSILSSLLYGFSFKSIGKLNEVLSGRVYYSYIEIKDNGVTILPKEISYGENNYIDNFYVKVVLEYGLLYALLTSVLIKFMKKNDDNNFEKIILMIFFINLVTEYSIIIIGNSIVLLILGNELIKDNINKNSIKKHNEENKRNVIEMKMVSAIIITHNRVDYLKKAFESVKNQTYKNIEIIVIDDNSNDGTKEFCTNQKDIKYIFIPEEEHKNGNYARNLGIKNSNGEYIAFLDDDDEWMPTKIEKQVELLENNTNVGMVYTATCTYINDGKIKFDTHVKSDLKGDCSKKSLYNIITSSSAIMIKRELLNETGLFDEELNYWQDTEFIIRLSQFTNFDYIDEPLIIYRETYSDKNRISNKVNGFLEAVEYINKKYNKQIENLSEEEKKERQILINNDLAHRYAKSNNKKLCKEALYKAFLIKPSVKHFLKYVLNYTKVKKYKRMLRLKEKNNNLYSI